MVYLLISIENRQIICKNAKLTKRIYFCFLNTSGNSVQIALFLSKRSLSKSKQNKTKITVDQLEKMSEEKNLKKFSVQMKTVEPQIDEMSALDIISTSPGLKHILETIFSHLNSKSLLGK